MNPTIAQGPPRDPFPTAPAGSTSRLRTVLTGLAIVAAVAAGSVAPAHAQPSSEPEPADPTPVACVSLTTATTFKTTGGPFDGGTKLTWNVTSPCPEVVVTLNGATVARSGSKVVDPQVTSLYGLTARMGSATKSLGSQVAVGGDIIGYKIIRGRGMSVTTIPNPTTPEADEARLITADIIGGLSADAERRLLGRTLEVHIIPASGSLTLLPPWKSLQGTMTCNATLPDGSPNEGCVAPRPWSSVRGVGGQLIAGTNRIAMAVGQEELVAVPTRPTEHSLGHILAHELGHTVLDFAAPQEKANVQQVYNGNSDTHDYMGWDDYTSTNYHEYFAEGTSAMFEYDYAERYEDEYTRAWLMANEPKLYAILARIYPGAV